MDDPIEAAGQPRQIFRPGDVSRQRFDAGGGQFGVRRRTAAHARDVVSQPDQFRSERQADVTAAEDQDAHEHS